MRRFQFAFVVLSATIGLAHAGTQAEPDGAASRAQIQRVVDTFRTAIIAKDKGALSSLFMPTGTSWMMVIGDELYQRMKTMRPGVTKIKPGSYQEFVDSIGAIHQRIEERFSNLHIDTDGAVASVYFDYVFLTDNNETNRGSETWQLVNTGDGWKISALSYSIDSAKLE
jgi:hypothetical protein